jgi:hypothetical protein
MNKLQMDPPVGLGAPPRFVVKVQHVARPSSPWTWAIYEETGPEPVRCSTRFYRCAEDAWAVGHAMLERLPRPAIRAAPSAQSNAAPADDLTLG